MAPTPETFSLLTPNGRRSFQVARNDAGTWTFTGKRGASYIAIRQQHNPALMFLRSLTCTDPLGFVRLTDQSGRLEQVETFAGCVLTDADKRFCVLEVRA